MSLWLWKEGWNATKPSGNRSPTLKKVCCGLVLFRRFPQRALLETRPSWTAWARWGTGVWVGLDSIKNREHKVGCNIKWDAHKIGGTRNRREPWFPNSKTVTHNPYSYSKPAKHEVPYGYLKHDIFYTQQKGVCVYIYINKISSCMSYIKIYIYVCIYIYIYPFVFIY